MPTFRVETPQHEYDCVVQRGAIASAAQYLPPKHGKVFVVSTGDVWRHQGGRVAEALSGVPHDVLFLPGGEEQKRMAPLEALAERLVELGADRTSVIVAFGGGVVTDMAGFLAAIFMRGIPVIQISTTLLGQVDASIGGKTGVNLVTGKNLVGAFHPPAAVLIDPNLLDTLPDREFRSGLWEIVKAGIIRDRVLFDFLVSDRDAVVARHPHAVEAIIERSVAMKVEVVSGDEQEADLRRILNFGHTFGHALESETRYVRFLHGEAVAWGMRAAVYLGQSTGYLSAQDAVEILDVISRYGPIPPLDGISAENLFARLVHDKKTVHGQVHFIVPVRIGETKVVSGVDERLVREAIRSALA